MVPDEPTEFLMALFVAVRRIVKSRAQAKLRIANACVEARSFIATIDHDCGSASPRIEACLNQFNVHKNAEDTVAPGWLLVAIQKRVSERDLDGWRVSAEDLKTAGDMATALILAVVPICLVLVSPFASFLQPMTITASTPDHNQAVRSSDHG